MDIDPMTLDHMTVEDDGKLTLILDGGTLHVIADRMAGARKVTEIYAATRSHPSFVRVAPEAWLRDRPNWTGFVIVEQL